MPADKKTLIRRIVDYLHKYGTDKQVHQIARMLPISMEDKKERG